MERPGWVVWEGKSLLDGSDIVVILTEESQNKKTGNIWQTTILVRDTHPVEAADQGLDFAICGNCKMRRCNMGGCYVLLFQAPRGVWQKYKMGGYKEGWPAPTIKPVRLGSYGDPAAVPLWVWVKIIMLAKSHTGYTHQWRTCANLRGICMASVDTPEEYLEAKKMGWGTFRCRLPDESLFPEEIDCPGYCATCGECDGTGNVSVVVHGRTKRKYFEWRCQISDTEG